MYLEGRGIKQDYIKAYRYLSKAAEKGHRVVKSLLVAPIKETIKNIDYEKILGMFKAVTLNGTASLEYNIGCLYENGFGDHNSRRIIESNFSYAVFWYHLGEQKNIPEAIYKLERLYQFGRTSRTYNLSSHFYKKGMILKNLDSLYALALQNLYGEDFLGYTNEAFNQFFQAATLGHPDARSILSLLYGNKASADISFNNSRVKTMIYQVARDGNTIVQYHLGLYYESSGDIKLAMKWYMLATEEKLTGAYYRLGRMYETKDYQNISKAIKLYETVSDNYHDEAAYRGAQFYHYGIGISKHYSKASQLYTKAATLGNWSATTLLNIKQLFKKNCVGTLNDTGISNTTAIENKLLNLTSGKLKDLPLMHEYIAIHGNPD
jgi:TPR repeat protein